MKRKNPLVASLLLSVALLIPGTGYAETKEITITITEDGFTPPNVTVEKGEVTKLLFIRKVKKTCITKIVIPDLEINKELPLNKTVAIEITPEKSGVIGFSCPMNMIKGEVKVTDKK